LLKVLRINAKTRKIDVEQYKDEYRLLGGRSLISQVMSDEVNPTCDPLGAENKLIFCTSLFAGTPLSAAHRLSVGGKSPLTGGIKEANSGGTTATAMARHGIKMIIVEDLPESEEWSLLKISADGTPELLPADEYVGLNTYDMVDKMKERFGDSVAVTAIGKAGERGYRNSSLQSIDHATGKPSRAAARGGMGAVMGAKKIKAVVIEKSNERYAFPYADKEKFSAASKKFAEILRNNEGMKWLHEVGTPAITEITSGMSVIPYRNFSGETNKKASAIGPGAYMEKIHSRGGKTGETCQVGCVIQCSGCYNDANGEYLTSGFEYETVALCGSNLDIDDLDVIARMDRLCDDIGLDTMETGGTLGVCMEAGKIAWGDGEAAITLLEEMNEGTEFGRLLGQGTYEAGKALGVKRIPTVKRQSLSAYDPRNLKGTGVTYATSAMGADHTSGLTLEAPIDPLAVEGQADTSKFLQPMMAIADSMMCIFNWFSAGSPETIPGLMEGAYGGEWDFDKVLGLGREAILRERAFNEAAGFTSKDDRLPEFFLNEKSPASGQVFDVKDEELDNVFKY